MIAFGITITSLIYGIELYGKLLSDQATQMTVDVITFISKAVILKETQDSPAINMPQ